MIKKYAEWKKENEKQIEQYKKFIIPYLKQYMSAFCLAVIFGLLTVLGNSALTFTSGYLISSASLMPYNILMLYVPIVLVRAFGISQAVTRYIERLIGHNAVLKILSNMRVKLYEVLEPQALFIRSRFRTGDLLGTLADDIEHLQDVYIRTILPTIIALSVFAFSFISLAVFDWLFALWIAICLGIIVFVYPVLSLILLKKHQMKQKKIRSQLYSSLTDAIFGLSDWLISGKKEHFVKSYIKHREADRDIERKLQKWDDAREFQLRAISGIILVMVALWAGKEAMHGEFAPAYIAAFTLVTLPIIDGLIPVSNAIERLPVYEESLARIDAIEKNRIEEKKQEPVPINRNEGKIVLKNVSFKYSGGQEDSLKNISFTINNGEKIAILGKSGAGKSTLLQLIQGTFLPNDGKVAINGIEPNLYGDNIYDLISVLNQKPYLFATTVANNIRLGKDDATDEEIGRVIEKVGLHDYIYSLPKGLQTQMEEAGQRFSGGERQRIALSRILLKDTPIVILDEPTVGLDPVTEKDLVDTIFKVLEDKTVIWVTHHLMGIEKMDQILFLDNGKIAMHGAHQELFEINERYRQLYELDQGFIID